jgi:hypothetical protein
LTTYLPAAHDDFVNVATVTQDDAYMMVTCLQRAGQWDLALRCAPQGPAGAALRAQVLTDRHSWRLDAAAQARAAISEVARQRPGLAGYLAAQLEYWRRLAGPVPGAGNAEEAGPAPEPADAFAALRAEPGLRAWATFWHAVTLENLHGDTGAAAAGYARARDLAVAGGDLLLESYAVRHIGGQALDAGDQATAIALARRSLHLRAACGARPHAAAAQVLLADALGAGPEAAQLRAIAAITAAELGLTWLHPLTAEADTHLGAEPAQAHGSAGAPVPRGQSR